MKIMVKPTGEGDTVFEDGAVVKAADFPAGGLAVLLTPFVRRRLASGELVNVTPEAGVPADATGLAELVLGALPAPAPAAAAPAAPVPAAPAPAAPAPAPRATVSATQPAPANDGAKP